MKERHGKSKASAQGAGNVPSERPILFSGEMIRRILDGAKTQTRRVVRPQPVIAQNNGCAGPTYEWKGVQLQGVRLFGKRLTGFCKYGQSGDRLWVRETFAHVPLRESDGGQGDKMGAIYRADGDDAFAEMPDEWEFMGKWRPSIFMPRWASRITLEITNVRAERVGQLSHNDALAEGLESIQAFAQGWDRLNAKRGYSWSQNPYVWVLEFRRVTG